MCTVSKLIEYGQTQIPADKWDWQKWMAFHALIEKAKVFDALTNQPNCANESKIEWAIKVEQRLRDLEKRS